MPAAAGAGGPQRTNTVGTARCRGRAAGSRRGRRIYRRVPELFLADEEGREPFFLDAFFISSL